MSTTYRGRATEQIGLASDGGSVLTFDFRTFLVTLGLVAIGLISLYSATYEAGASAMFESQLYFAILGFGVMLGVAFVPERWIRIVPYPAYILSLLALAAVMVIGT